MRVLAAIAVVAICAGCSGYTSSPAQTSLSNGAQTVTGAKTFTSPVTVNANAAALPTPAGGTLVQGGNADGTAAVIALDTFGNNAKTVYRRANNTNASPTALANNDLIGSIASVGYGATAYAANASADFELHAGQSWTDSNQGTYATIGTTPLNSTTMRETARFNADGTITTGVASTLTGGVNFAHASSANLTTVQAASTATAHSVTLPPGVCTSGQTWIDNGSGVMTCGSGGGGSEWLSRMVAQCKTNLAATTLADPFYDGFSRLYTDTWTATTHSATETYTAYKNGVMKITGNSGTGTSIGNIRSTVTQVQPNADWCLAARMKFAAGTATGFSCIIGANNTGGSNPGVYVGVHNTVIDSTHFGAFTVNDAGSVGTGLIGTAFDSNFHDVMAWYTTSDSKLYMSVDNANTVSEANGTKVSSTLVWPTFTYSVGVGASSECSIDAMMIVTP